MRKTTALIFCCALIFVSGEETKINAKPDTATVAAKPVLEDPAVTKTTATTIKPTTSTQTTSTSTAPPDTTTSTTAKPTTSTSAPTTNAPPVPPTPVPEPKVGKWIVNSTDIIIVQMATQLDIQYNNTKNQSVHQLINIPIGNETTATPKLNGNIEGIELSWKSTGKENNSVTINFKKDDTSKTFALSSLEVSVAPEALPDSGLTTPLKLVHSTEHFNTSIDNSYRCARLQNFNLTRDGESKPTSQMKVSDLQFQAFKTDKKGTFGYAIDCAFDTPDAVPIAVGCILAGLVVIVLVAYLISRKRNQNRGYLSM